MINLRSLHVVVTMQSYLLLLYRKGFNESASLMKAPLRQKTKFSYLTHVTFETASSSTVVEPFIDLWTPNELVFI